MNSLILFIFLVAFSLFTNSFAKGKPISGEVPRGNRIIDGIQYVNKGSPYFSLDEAPIIVEIDTTDHSITIFVPSIAPPESLYIKFIPSSMFKAILSAEVIWNEETDNYQYEYTIISDSNSITPIMHFGIEWWNDYEEVYAPKDWTASSLNQTVHSGRVNYWSSYISNKVQGGDTLSGIGYQSYGPPVITPFELWCELNVLDASGSDEMFGSIYSGISEIYRGVKGYTIAAWVSPESIEPVDWFDRICDVPILVTAGYLDKETKSAIYPTLYKLSEEFQLKENQTLEKLEQEVNRVLDTLEPYRNQMEPEAQAFIFENLKYILRHKDIVKFKEYP
jgi:hypothetical protein